MATAQEVRKKNHLITKPLNQTSSKVFMKELVALTLSNIAYQRSLFPENGFTDIVFEGRPCKLLYNQSKCKEAKSLIQWIDGAFEAFDKGYLKEMMLCLEPDASENGEIIEAFKFTFSHEDEVIFSSQDSNGQCTNVEINDKPDVSELLTFATKFPEPESFSIYDNLKMYMRLLYYDEVTPSDYEPRGYHKTDFPLKFKYATEQVSFSDVRTNWHGLEIKTKTLKNPCVLEAVENKLRNEKSINDQVSATKEVFGFTPSGVKRKSSNSPNPMGSQTPSEIQNSVVSCACGYNRESSGLIIKCSSCNFWQHGACYGLISDEVVPQEFYCFLCSIDNEEKICFDPSLTKLNDNDRKSLCIYRRVLAYCEINSRINLKSMANDLNIQEYQLNKIIANLEEDNVILLNRRGSQSLVRIVDSNNLKNRVIPKYFSKTSSPCIPKLF